jgi:serine/threonine-protein kinase RsbW
MNSSTITITLPGELRFIRLASKIAADTASLFTETCHAEPENWEFAHAFELAVSEAFTNAVVHAKKQDSPQPITITFTLEKQKLTLTMSDANAPFSTQTPSPNPDNYPENGYGLLLIRSVMDTVTLSRENDANIITMSKQL